MKWDNLLPPQLLRGAIARSRQCLLPGDAQAPSFLRFSKRPAHLAQLSGACSPSPGMRGPPRSLQQAKTWVNRLKLKSHDGSVSENQQCGRDFPQGAAWGHLGEAGPYLAPEILCQAPPCRALESYLAHRKQCMSTMITNVTIIIVVLVARRSGICLGLSFEKVLPSYRIKGWILGPVAVRPMEKQYDSLRIDSSNRVRPSMTSLCSLNSQPAELWLGPSDLPGPLQSPESCGSNEHLIGIHRMGWWKWNVARLLSPRRPELRSQKSDSENVHLALQSRFPE